MFLPLLLIASGSLLRAQEAKFVQVSTPAPESKYQYTSVEGDPLQARTYVLKNGLTVIISVNKSEPRIQTFIATKAGGKHDPATNTGLAHYLEHMLFKGTDQFGTKDFAREKALLDNIEALYEEYNHTTDEAKRKQIYHAIDSVSGLAAKYAIANEYDKLMASIGAKGTNASTWPERTVYVNDIPQNQLEKWLTVESERFRNPVLRLFHTELEAVYEEKNIGLDDDGLKVYEATLASLFKNHTYGTQTVIGTVEHLKNPSLKEIRKYYETYYVPNNMAFILAGDVDPDEAVALIDKYFGWMTPKPVPALTFRPETARTSPEEITITGPDRENVQIAYRFPGANTHDAILLEATDLLLAYKNAGLIDLNLNKQQKVLQAYSSPMILQDYSVHFFNGVPNQGQSLEEVRDLLLQQVAKIKKGEFEDDALAAVIKNLKVDQIRQYEENGGRAGALLDAFTLGQSWDQYSAKLRQMSKITKKDIVDFANKYYTNDYVVIYKRMGEDKSIVKVEKPEITPVEVNREDKSPFLTKVMNMPTTAIQPVFVDYKKDISTLKLKNGTEVYYLPNRDNELFSMNYVFDMGRRNDRKLVVAAEYLRYLGTNKYSSEALAKEFFKLGSTFNVSAGEEQVSISLSGLEESFEPAFKLFEEFLANLKPDQKALDALVEQILKGREDAKLDKQTILWNAMRNYAIYGKNNPTTDILSEKELRSLKAADLVKTLKSLTSYRHRVLYYGPRSQESLTASLNAIHKMPPVPRDYPQPVVYKRQETKENKIYFVDFDMVQAEIIWLNKSVLYDPAVVPTAAMFNEYFGGGMSSVVFQTIRESKALAYSTFSQYMMPQKKEDPFYVTAYIGTQADKLPEAIPAMNALLTDMPEAQQSFEAAREGLRNQIATERITKADVLFSYLTAQRRGLDRDIRSDIYASLDKTTIADLRRFHAEHLNNSGYSYLVLGSKNRVNMTELRKYGTVVELTLKDVFGY